METLKEYLSVRLANCERAKAKIFERYKGLDGKTICCDEGLRKDAYINGKIAILKDLLELLQDKDLKL